MRFGGYINCVRLNDSCLTLVNRGLLVGVGAHLVNLGLGYAVRVRVRVRLGVRVRLRLGLGLGLWLG